MIGSLVSMAGYWVVMFFLVLWMMIRTYRASPLLAILMFFFWPVALIALISNWGDEESDIRTPFFLALLAGGMGLYMAGRAVDKAVDEAAPYLSDEEIMLIRQDDPEMADRIEIARAAAWAEEDAEAEYDDEPTLPRPMRSARPAAAAEVVEAPRRELSQAELQAARQQSLSLAANGLSFQFGELRVPEAKASLPLPKRFRLAPRRSLPMIARLRGTELTADLRGWLIHDAVDMSRDSAWLVEWHVIADNVPAASTGRLPVALRSSVDQKGKREGPVPLSWSEDGELLQWSSADSNDDAADVFAARRVHGGWFVFVMRDADGERHELATRATRLFASRVARADRA